MRGVNWDLGIISPPSEIFSKDVNLQVATSQPFVVNPSNPPPPPVINWDLGINKATTEIQQKDRCFIVQATSFTVNPRNPVPPSRNYDLGLNQLTVRGWLWGRRPAVGLQFPRGVYNY